MAGKGHKHLEIDILTFLTLSQRIFIRMKKSSCPCLCPKRPSPASLRHKRNIFMYAFVTASFFYSRSSFIYKLSHIHSFVDIVITDIDFYKVRYNLYFSYFFMLIFQFDVLLLVRDSADDQFANIYIFLCAMTGWLQ